MSPLSLFFMLPEIIDQENAQILNAYNRETECRVS